MTAQRDDYTEVECSCKTCVGMCQHFPCRPMPDEVARMDPERLMLSMMSGHHGEQVEHLQAAAQGRQRRARDWYHTTPCIFLTDEGLCELHGTAKPYEGRMADCQKRYPEGHYDTVHDLCFSDRLSELLFEAWDTDEGRRIVALWKETVGYVQ